MLRREETGGSGLVTRWPGQAALSNFTCHLYMSTLHVLPLTCAFKNCPQLSPIWSKSSKIWSRFYHLPSNGFLPCARHTLSPWIFTTTQFHAHFKEGTEVYGQNTHYIARKKQSWVKSPGPLTPKPWPLITCSPPPSTTIRRLFLSSFTLKGCGYLLPPYFAEPAQAVLSGHQEMAMEPHL